MARRNERRLKHRLNNQHSKIPQSCPSPHCVALLHQEVASEEEQQRDTNVAQREERGTSCAEHEDEDERDLVGVEENNGTSVLEP